MSDPIRDVVGDEARAVLVQFMGQELPELHKIDKHITNRTSSLQGLTLNMQDVLSKIPGSMQTSQPAPQPQQVPTPPQIQVPVQPFIQQATSVPQTDTETTPIIEDPNQMLFNFNYDVAKDIADKLAIIDKRLEKIEHLTNKITISLNATASKTKKKLDSDSL